MIGEIPRASWPDVLADTGARVTFLEGFVRFGLALLRDVPCDPGSVLDVADELGEIRVTSWGKVFDVVSMIDANSVAYTNLPLVTHTDEGYRDPAPTVQLQHFLRSDASGGESTLVDGFRIADDLRRADPDAFALLASTPLDFHFADATAEHHNHNPVIEVDGSGEVRAVRFSNHSVQPFLLPFDRMEAYYAAYRRFGTMRENDEYRLRIPMGAGELYMVDNRRVLHGRTGFSGSGARHLQSCYIERDELVSRLAVLRRAGR
jgi:gamma-butyrobetaine dioxygenase